MRVKRKKKRRYLHDRPSALESETHVDARATSLNAATHSSHL